MYCLFFSVHMLEGSFFAGVALDFVERGPSPRVSILLYMFVNKMMDKTLRCSFLQCFVTTKHCLGARFNCLCVCPTIEKNAVVRRITSQDHETINCAPERVVHRTSIFSHLSHISDQNTFAAVWQALKCVPLFSLTFSRTSVEASPT